MNPVSASVTSNLRPPTPPAITSSQPAVPSREVVVQDVKMYLQNNPPVGENNSSSEMWLSVKPNVPSFRRFTQPHGGSVSRGIQTLEQLFKEILQDSPGDVNIQKWDSTRSSETFLKLRAQRDANLRAVALNCSPFDLPLPAGPPPEYRPSSTEYVFSPPIARVVGLGAGAGPAAYLSSTSAAPVYRSQGSSALSTLQTDLGNVVDALNNYRPLDASTLLSEIKLDAIDSDLTSGRLNRGEFKDCVDLLKLASKEVTTDWKTALPESAKYKLGALLDELESRVIVRRCRSDAFDETPQLVPALLGSDEKSPVTTLCCEMTAWQSPSVMSIRSGEESTVIEGYLLGPNKEDMKGALNQLYMAADTIPKTDRLRK